MATKALEQPSLDQTLDQILEYWHVLERHKWQILVVTCTLTLVFTVLIARMPNVYQATTTILVDPQKIPERIVSPAVSSEPEDRLGTIRQEVLSRTQLEKVVDKLNLYPELRKVEPPEVIIEEMRRNITIDVKQGSGLGLSAFTISFEGRDPELVAPVANELATSFIRENLESREQLVTGTKDFLSDEMEEAKRDLEQQESKLSQFKMSHPGETPDQVGSNFQALAGLRSQLQANAEAMNRLDQERILLTRLPEPVALGNTGTLSERGRLELEKHQLLATLAQLRQQYTDDYPDVGKASRRLSEIDAQLKALPADAPASNGNQGEASASSVRLELIDREMKRLKADQGHLQAQIAAYQAKVDAAPLREQQYIELTRNYNSSQQHYQTLLDKSLGLRMASDLEQKQKAERYKVLDPARVPERPVKPKRRLLIPMSSFAALGLSILGVIGKEVISPAIKTEQELKSLLPAGVRLLGYIPRIETAADGRRRRRVAVLASLTCLLLCLAVASVVWKIYPVL